MKTKKILLPVVALFISALAFGQKSNANGQYKAKSKTHQQGEVKKESARVNGATKANANANVNAQRNANANSVLNGTGTARTKYKARVNQSDAGRRKYNRKKAE